MKNSVLKRVIGYTLICVMLLASFSTVAFASATGEPEVTFAMNFDGFDDGTKISKTMGWNHIEGPGDLIASDAENGKYLNLINNGYRNINVASETLSSGKVYISFSYKYAVPTGLTGATGTNALAIYAQSTVGIASTKIESTMYTGATSDERKAQRDAENFYIGLLNANLKVDNNSSSTDTALETVGSDLNDGEWHEIGYELNLVTKKLKAFVDNEASAEYDFSADYTSGTLGAIGFKTPNPGYYFGSVDNFVVKHIPESATNEVTATAVKDETSKTIDITFDEPISPTVLEAITANVTMKLCGSSTPVNVDSVTKVNGAIQLTYTGDLAQGREYYIDLPDNLTSIFGTDLPEGIFVNAEPKENLTSVLDTRTFETGSGTESVEGLYYAYAPTVVDMPSGTTGNSSTKVLQPNTTALWFGKSDVISQADLKGMTVYELDYICSGTVGVMYYTDKPAKWLSSTNGQWKKMRVEVDYAANECRVYIEGTLSGTGKDSTVVLSQYSRHQQLYFGGVANLQTAGLYIDNFKEYYVESKPSVKKVRYIDTDNTEIGVDTIKPQIKEIEITFSESMDEDSLEAIAFSDDDCVTGRSYDDTTYTYTLTCGNLLKQNTPYTLTIPKEVKNESGISISETTYNFNTTAGIFEVSNIKLKKDGIEIAKADLAAIAGNRVTVSADVINTNATPGELTLIYVLYEDDEMVDVNHQTLTKPQGRDILATDVFTVKAGINPNSAKVFVWNGELTDLEPIAKTEY